MGVSIRSAHCSGPGKHCPKHFAFQLEQKRDLFSYLGEEKKKNPLTLKGEKKKKKEASKRFTSSFSSYLKKSTVKKLQNSLFHF